MTSKEPGERFRESALALVLLFPDRYLILKIKRSQLGGPVGASLADDRWLSGLLSVYTTHL